MPLPLLLSSAVLGCPGASPESPGSPGSSRSPCDPGEISCLLSGWQCWGGRTPGHTGIRLLRLACLPGAAAGPSLSFLSSGSVGVRSPLRAKAPGRPLGPADVYAKNPHPAQPAQRAVRPVKSSGYGVAPRTRRFVPAVNRPSRATPGQTPGGQPRRNPKSLLERVDCRRLQTWTPPLQMRAKVSLWDEYGAAVRLASSADGTHLACSTGPVLSVLRWCRPSVDDCVTAAGHDARVASLSFSTDSTWLLSASHDGTSKVWDWKSKRCVLDINKADKTCNKRKGVGPVTQAAFYYMDKFILQAVKDNLELYGHRLFEDDGRQSATERIEFPTQQVTCFVAPNAFHSNLVVAGCASRSLHVYDLGAERFALELHDAHPRPPHRLAIATPSAASPAGAADLFLSTSVCDGVKLWDMRQARCVQKYTRHLNRSHGSGIALSACCRFLAVCSEDKCVYLYDTRQSYDRLDKLLGLNDVVWDVEWNPCRPELAASAVNGCVAVYAA